MLVFSGNSLLDNSMSLGLQEALQEFRNQDNFPRILAFVLQNLHLGLEEAVNPGDWFGATRAEDFVQGKGEGK
ncbi:hypothetical protein SUGI_0718570 [Cryptomeria japonica]|nr:hypothetical protein SUGI_0718570 [Cryptomeria japonica]